MKIVFEVLSAAAFVLGVISLFIFLSKSLRKNMEKACGGTFPIIGWNCVKVAVDSDFQLELFMRHCHAVAERAQVESNVEFDKLKRGYGIDLHVFLKEGFLVVRPKKLIFAHPYLLILAMTIAMRPWTGLAWLIGVVLVPLIDFNGEAELVKVLAQRERRVVKIEAILLDVASNESSVSGPS